MGRIQQLTQAKVDQHLTFFTCDQLIAELDNVLQRPKITKRLSLPGADYINFHRTLCVTHAVRPFPATEFMGTIPDPKDEYLFALAKSAKVSFLVTGDKPLQDITDASYVSIISLAEFRKQAQIK
jgi:putative PIN family toxin of toxin-antitoxin system